MQPYSHHSALTQKTGLRVISKNTGFSLIEILVAITIMALLTGIAVPDFSKLISGNRVNAVSAELFTSLSAARSYAINNHALVHVCAKSQLDPSKCDEKRDFNANWSRGWLIFSDINANNELDEQDTVLQSIQIGHNTNIVFNQRGRLRFFPDGSARSAGFYLCDKAKKHFKHVLLLHTGRARSKKQLSERQRVICGSV